PFVHRIDPIIGEIAGLYLWWYGLSYTLGFLGIYLWFRRVRNRLDLSVAEVLDISICFSAGVLIGGRLVEVVFYEWDYYGNHLWQIPAYWLGGMSTHGLLLGATVGTWVFCWWRGRDFLSIVDELVIPGAYVMGMGRIGNFIDGQIVGATTDVWWAVQFPDADGFRHPVVLYDGAKNFLLVPLLLLIRKTSPPRGVVFAHFLFWYAFLRIFVDLYREYRVDLFDIGTGQVINISMSLIGLSLLIWFARSNRPHTESLQTMEGSSLGSQTSAAALWTRRIILAFILFFCLTIPSDWTQDIPARCGKRHPGLTYSGLYPRIEPTEAQ
ncbi:prolipoprotein diacylglyceryl transferase, partial [Acidobacteria bacterium AH-259-G07]|nr:prolipoprotein diacylglyceryl transferase [Acidobacteria bacterium AH-259-G07]